MQTRYTVDEIAILRFSNSPDEQGHIIPHTVKLLFNNPIPVFFEYEQEMVIGWAHIRKTKDLIVAKLDLFSDAKNQSAARSIIKKLYPSLGFRVLKISPKNKSKITKIQILCVGLTHAQNVDPNISPIGDHLVLRGSETLH